MSKGVIFLSAGGTGGHLFPAEALAHTLKQRGYSVHLVTDSRAERYASSFPAEAIHAIPSSTIGSKNPIAVARALMLLARGFLASRRVIGKVKPLAVVGFGGYPTLPPLLAAATSSVPTLIHEQNAVMGRANRMLAGRVRAIAGGFLAESGAHAAKIVTTGNPVRPAVTSAAAKPYQPSTGSAPFRLVVFGGSQGAQFFSQAVPKAIARLPDAARSRLLVTQQARPEDAEGVRQAYAKLGVDAEIAPFFTDMAERIAAAHVVVCRSGASTVSELSVIGRPALLVPYPYALDHDQAANAAALAAGGGAVVFPQAELSTERLAEFIGRGMREPQWLADKAQAARAVGRPNAASLLADLVEAIAAGKTVKDYKETRS